MCHVLYLVSPVAVNGRFAFVQFRIIIILSSVPRVVSAVAGGAERPLCLRGVHIFHYLVDCAMCCFSIILLTVPCAVYMLLQVALNGRFAFVEFRIIIILSSVLRVVSSVAGGAERPLCLCGVPRSHYPVDCAMCCILLLQVALNGRFAFVEFRVPEYATAALQLNGQIALMGNTLKIARPASYVEMPVRSAAAQRAAHNRRRYQHDDVSSSANEAGIHRAGGC
jgi:hypothetical protein